MRILWAIQATAVAVTVTGCTSNWRPGVSPQQVIAAKFAAVNRHSVSGVVSLYAPDAQVLASDFCRPRRGRAEVRRTYEALFAKYPAIEVEIQDYVVQGERVVVRYTVRNPTPGTGFAVPIMNWFVVRNGLIESDDGRFDFGGRPCSP